MTDTFKETAHFVIAGARCSVTIEGKRRSGGPQARLTIDLQPVPADALEYSFTGMCGGAGGQCHDSIEEAAAGAGASSVVRLCAIWRAAHMNGLKPGTRAQMHALESMPGASALVGQYDTAKAYL